MLDLSQLHVQKLADKAKLIKNFEANCACCGAKLPKFPVRSITCPSCSKKLYVENNPVYNKKVLVSEEEKVTLKELDEANKKIYKAIGRTLDEKPLSTGSNDAYWQQLNNALANQSQSKQTILDTLYQMFLLACHEQNHSLAFERLPAILSLEFGLSVEERLKTDKDFIFISYGRTIFRPYFLQPLLFEDDLPYLEALLTNQEYKARYEYFYNLAGFDGDIIWQCIEAEYKRETTFFEYLHKQVINTPPRADATPKSLLSKIKSKFFN